jgi:hypothetical protein
LKKSIKMSSTPIRKSKSSKKEASVAVPVEASTEPAYVPEPELTTPIDLPALEPVAKPKSKKVKKPKEAKVVDAVKEEDVAEPVEALEALDTLTLLR